MPKLKKYSSENMRFHISAKCTHPTWFSKNLSDVWILSSTALNQISVKYKLEVNAFVLMGNHFHLLLTISEIHLNEAMVELHQIITNQFLRILRESNNSQKPSVKEVSDLTDISEITEIFDGPFHCSMIKNSIYFHKAYKYVYRNPIHAGICFRVEDYPFSTLRGLLGLDPLQIPIIDHLRLIQDPFQVLNWLNSEQKQEQE